MTYVEQDADLVKKVMYAMADTFDMYKDAAPGNVGWGLNRQKLDWVMPYHDGAIAFFKEKGMWTEAHQKNQDMLLKRQKILADTWKAVKGKTHANDDEFQKDWMKSRAQALTAAGMDPVMASW